MIWLETRVLQEIRRDDLIGHSSIKEMREDDLIGYDSVY